MDALPDHGLDLGALVLEREIAVAVNSGVLVSFSRAGMAIDSGFWSVRTR